jgi:hypothetical protein
MSLSKSKCWYLKYSLHFLKRAVPLTKDDLRISDHSHDEAQNDGK